MAQWYDQELGKVSGMRLGITTGSCAQAAARAALEFLLGIFADKRVEITLPKGHRRYSGRQILVPVESIGATSDGTGAEALVRKDSGDDPDITDGILIGARVRLKEGNGVEIDGAEGVGRITRPGLAGKVGEAAINPIPRRMIREELLPLLPEGKGCRVEIFVPEGIALAEKTWNPRIGILGGISIIGTKGVVEPKSEEAYKASINRVIHSYLKSGMSRLIITPGYVGEAFLSSRGIALDRVVTVGDHVGHALLRGADHGAKELLLVGHIGKLTKIAVAMFNTHWSSGDARLEVIAAYAGAAGASAEKVRRLLSLSLAEEAVALIHDWGLDEIWNAIARRAAERTEKLVEGRCTIGVVLLDLKGHSLGSWPKERVEGWLK
ncbi:cobalt-precorrin-5B (C(1))-methyltransferase CbiD [Sediminispirochaeta smaragdinae]|uniref:Cobalt-precorrin-5B C(1)-methyltransferase n=1 Tax=Sediminispirochaeta smaragdinae (strain DSM 11293 / JCM 15392 / SEBR 4228) TaxID=573413 RepID=E1R8J8_SEDSS|nr:cobalt-precorrin-5B (C(1))-methyltransferase CbiD [Sediminispirochaeta smaragdinae]ADK79342.1 cobalamin biosynthesis protein CbiD [Sediminispirochaeta smaragdinae DSM 11293]